MRRPDVFTLDYSHPLAQGLVFAGLGAQGVIGNGSPYYDASIVKRPAIGIGTSYSEFLPEINRHVQVFNAANQSAIDMGAGLPNSGPFSFGMWVWTNTVNSMAMSSRTGGAPGFELLTGNGGIRGAWLWRSAGGNTSSMSVDDTVVHHCVFVLVNVSGAWKIQTYLDGTLFSEQSSSTSNFGQSQNPHLAKRYAVYWDGKIADPAFYNRALSPAEIALLAGRTDPMLGGLVREVNPVSYFDFGASDGADYDGPAIITAESTIAMLGQKGAVGPATVSAPVSLGMGGVKGVVSQAWIGADSELVAAGAKAGVGSVAWLAAGSFWAGKAPDVTPITAAEVARTVSATARMKTVTASARVRKVRYEVTRA